jgi:Na+/melibiose symporter-like transporter
MPETGRRLPRNLLLLYAVGSIGTGLFSSVTGVLLLFYVTDTLGVPPALAGLALFVPKAWDVLFDPLVGAASDRHSGPRGRRQPFLIAGALLTPLAFWALFSLPLLESVNDRVMAVGALFFLSMSGYALFSVPYAAMPAEMSDDAHERTVIMSFRMGFVLVGTLMGAVAGPMLVSASGGGRSGYVVMALVMGALIALAMLATALSASRMPAQAAASHQVPLLAQLRGALTHRRYATLLAAYVLVLVGNGTMAAAAPYFVVNVLGQESKDVGLIFGSLLVTAMLAMPLWVWVARRWGKWIPGVAAMLVFGAALALMALINQKLSPALLHGLCALAGVGFAGSQLLPFSILTDVIEQDRQATGLHREGSFTGLFIAGEKAGLALGPLITGAALELGGFVASSQGAVAQSGHALTGIVWAFGAIPALLTAAGGLTLWWASRRA